MAEVLKNMNYSYMKIKSSLIIIITSNTMIANINQAYILIEEIYIFKI